MVSLVALHKTPEQMFGINTGKATLRDKLGMLMAANTLRASRALSVRVALVARRRTAGGPPPPAG